CGIREDLVTGVQTCALPIWPVFDGQVVPVQTDLWKRLHQIRLEAQELVGVHREPGTPLELCGKGVLSNSKSEVGELSVRALLEAIGRASCREGVESQIVESA